MTFQDVVRDERIPIYNFKRVMGIMKKIITDKEYYEFGILGGLIVIGLSLFETGSTRVLLLIGGIVLLSFSIIRYSRLKKSGKDNE